METRKNGQPTQPQLKHTINTNHGTTHIQVWKRTQTTNHHGCSRFKTRQIMETRKNGQPTQTQLKHTTNTNHGTTHTSMETHANYKSPRLFTVQDATHRSCEEVLNNVADRVGPGQEGFEISRVGSGRVRKVSHITGRVGSTWPEPTREKSHRTRDNPCESPTHRHKNPNTSTMESHIQTAGSGTE